MSANTLLYIVAGDNSKRCLGLTGKENDLAKESIQPRAARINEDETSKRNRISFDIWDKLLEKDVIKNRTFVRSYSSDNELQYLDEIVCGSYFTFFKTDDGRVFACGENTFGQLATGDTIDVKERPTLCKELVPLGPIKKIVAGFYFSFFINFRDEIYAFGNNSHGQLCAVEKDINTEAVHLDRSVLFSDEIVIKISAGTFHSAFLTEDGRVWTCGGNNEGQLGLDEDEDDEPEIIITPYEVCLCMNPIIASDVNCGRYHTVVLTKAGDIVVFGSLRYGQCGVGIQGRISIPTMLRQPQNTVFTKIWAKVDSTFMLSSDGHLFACGRGFEGNFGNGKPIEAENQANIDNITNFDNLECKNYPTPHMLDEFLPFQPADIDDIVIGGYCTFIILKDKRTIYSAGGNRYGQTLQNSPLPSIKMFKKIALEAGFINRIQKQSTQSLEFKVAAGELYSILYFRDLEKKGSVMQWFSVNYDTNTKSIFSNFYDVTIICNEDNTEDDGLTSQQNVDLEPLKKKKKFV